MVSLKEIKLKYFLNQTKKWRPIVANQEHLKILYKGVDFWNKWQLNNPKIKPDISWTNLIDLNLSGINFKRTNLSWTNLSDTILTRANFRGANARMAIFIGAVLSDTILSWVNFRGANFRKANLTRAYLYKADLSEAFFRRTIIDGIKLEGATYEISQMLGCITSEKLNKKLVTHWQEVVEELKIKL